MPGSIRGDTYIQRTRAHYGRSGRTGPTSHDTHQYLKMVNSLGKSGSKQRRLRGSNNCSFCEYLDKIFVDPLSVHLHQASCIKRHVSRIIDASLVSIGVYDAIQT